MTTKMKKVTTPQGVREVKRLQEPVRDFRHCGRPMRKLQHPSATTGELITVYVCAKDCGHQERLPQPAKVTT